MNKIVRKSQLFNFENATNLGEGNRFPNKVETLKMNQHCLQDHSCNSNSDMGIELNWNLPFPWIILLLWIAKIYSTGNCQSIIQLCLGLQVFVTCPTKQASVTQGLFKMGPGAGPWPRHTWQAQKCLRPHQQIKRLLDYSLSIDCKQLPVWNK